MRVCYLSSLLDLVLEPFEKGIVLDIYNGNMLREQKGPGKSTKRGTKDGRFVHQFHVMMRDSVIQHVEALAKCKVAHDVESVKVAPEGGVYGLLCARLDLAQKQIRVFRNSGFIVSQCCQLSISFLINSPQDVYPWR